MCADGGDIIFFLQCPITGNLFLTVFPYRELIFCSVPEKRTYFCSVPEKGTNFCSVPVPGLIFLMVCQKRKHIFDGVPEQETYFLWCARSGNILLTVSQWQGSYFFLSRCGCLAELVMGRITINCFRISSSLPPICQKRDTDPTVVNEAILGQ